MSAVEAVRQRTRLGQQRARVRMVAEPSSVPMVRRFVGDALSEWGRDQLVDDVSLCVTELSTNATLHGDGSFFEVELERGEDAVRLAVVDPGQRGARAITLRSELGELLELTADEQPTTGRGIAIVSALASHWGVEELPDGTRVWAEFGAGGDTWAGGFPGAPEARQPEDSASHAARADGSAGTASGDREYDAAPRAGSRRVTVTLVGCPVRLVRAHDGHIAELIRELQLISADGEHPRAARLAHDLEEIVERHATGWDAARLQAAEALRRGDELVDVRIVASVSPGGLRPGLARLRALLEEADAMAEVGELITLPAPDEIWRLRDWMQAQMADQTDDVPADSAPVSFAAWARAGSV
ncbi:MAG TPA: ATP-binding protein [Nocardioidaceae bacterium]|nr:ATP-binding protein [Nocardioidaceae bacterium]